MSGIKTIGHYITYPNTVLYLGIELPPEIANLTSLEYLNLFNNHLEVSPLSLYLMFVDLSRSYRELLVHYPS